MEKRKNMSDLQKRTGVIFNIQHFCIHDGPGIRTSVFFKGCPLHCLWCANPESQSGQIQILFSQEKCSGCRECEKVCPRSAISWKENKIETNPQLCNGCGHCVHVCEQQARELCGREITVEEILPEILEDLIFYGKDGGVTLSGGEVLNQSSFASAILQLAKEHGITTAIETSGFGSWTNLKELAPYCDTILYDIKHMDSLKHQLCTGVNNEKIQENLIQISKEFPACAIWLRVPLIPGYNDCIDNLEKIGKLASAIPSCQRVELLPYHNLGVGKRKQLGSAENFTTEIPSKEYMEELRNVVRTYYTSVK
jgi:pyruvate formate lyase activating enzyme